MIQDHVLQSLVADKEKNPTKYVVVDNFFEDEIAKAIAADFPAEKHWSWTRYNNALEVKLACNRYDIFGAVTYKAIQYLHSEEWLGILSAFDNQWLELDPGLHGGGLHMHGRGGKLNPHLDYELHPKLGLARYMNLIVYLSDWRPEWGGHLGFWGGKNTPEKLVTEIEPKFNRAVVFKTQNAWHGLSRMVNCPEGKYRKSLAVYYLTNPEELEHVGTRERALFAPTEDQKNDPDVLGLIKKRAIVGEKL